MEDKFHTFTHPVADIPLPGRFTNPFHYTPHPLCVIAAEETQEFLSKQEEWAEELRAGKMFAEHTTLFRATGFRFLRTGVLFPPGGTKHLRDE